MLDLLVTNASLADGRTGMSIAVQDGRIADVAPGLSAPAAETLDEQLGQALARMSIKDASVAVAAATGLPRRTVYARALALAGGGK